jgi:hypothetical protein
LAEYQGTDDDDDDDTQLLRCSIEGRLMDYQGSDIDE